MEVEVIEPTAIEALASAEVNQSIATAKRYPRDVKDCIKRATGLVTLSPEIAEECHFSVPRGGRLDVTMDWTNAASAVGFYLVPVNTCTVDEFNARTCDFLIRSEPSNVKPRLISEPNFSAGNYRWIVGNFSDEQESVALEIVLSEGDCAALAGGRPSVSRQEGISTRPLQRALHN